MGWSPREAATGCTYSFPTVFEAMTNAVGYLV